MQKSNKELRKKNYSRYIKPNIIYVGSFIIAKEREGWHKKKNKQNSDAIYIYNIQMISLYVIYMRQH